MEEAEALHAWEGAAGDRSPVLRRGAELQKRALDNLATAVSRTPLEGCGRPWLRKVTDHRPRTGVGDGSGDGARRASWSGK